MFCVKHTLCESKKKLHCHHYERTRIETQFKKLHLSIIKFVKHLYNGQKNQKIEITTLIIQKKKPHS